MGQLCLSVNIGWRFISMFVCYVNWYHTPYISYFFVRYRIFRMAIIQRSFSTRYH